MKKKGTDIGKRLLAMVLVATMAFTWPEICVSAETTTGENGQIQLAAAGSENPANPVHYCGESGDGSDYTDWSYVYFGSYPQTEVIGSVLTASIIEAPYDANGDAWLNGVKYRRISVDNTYRYFKWEKIRWRVLKNNDSTLFLMADKGLDCKNYNEIYDSVAWENCTLRNWLNDTFYKTAFSSSEQNAIVEQNVVNEDNPEYGTNGGNNTKDKVYLLSIREAQDTGYGFCGKNSGSSNSVSRGVQPSDYANARGVRRVIETGNFFGNCYYWWLRSPGYSTRLVADVAHDGYVHRTGNSVHYDYSAVVPALHINLESDIWNLTDDGSSGAGGSIGNTAPTVSDPVAQSVKVGSSATFSVSASGGGPDIYTYQWYYAASQTGAGTKIEGATSASYTIPASQVTNELNGRYYYCVVSNGAYEVESARAKLTVVQEGNAGNNTPPSLKTQKITASSFTKEYGSKPFSLKAKTTGNGKLTYKTSNKKVAAVSSNGKVTVKNYGTATITIKAAKTSKYKAASAKVTVKVVPKKAALTKASAAGNRKVSIKWKKTGAIDGYEMYLSLKKNFKSETYKRVYGKNQTSVTLTGLQKGKTYYIKTCCYKKVGKKTYYGSWSKVRKVKIR